MIKPISPFRAVVPGSAYPIDFTPDDELEPHSEAARAALNLGCLSDGDAEVVRRALNAEAAQTDTDPDTDADPDPKPKSKPKSRANAAAKAQGAAPENKSGGAKS